MRSRNIKYFFDAFMWYLLYLLPLLVLLFMVFRTGSVVTIDSVFSSLGLSVFNDNIILSTLSQIFGQSGVFPLFTSDGILIYASYFISVYLIHIAVDILIFLPRLVESFSDKMSKGGDF